MTGASETVEEDTGMEVGVRGQEKLERVSRTHGKSREVGGRKEGTETEEVKGQQEWGRGRAEPEGVRAPRTSHCSRRRAMSASL